MSETWQRAHPREDVGSARRRNCKIEPWMVRVAISIVKNVILYHKDYEASNCSMDVAQEIANAHRHGCKRQKITER